MSGHRSHRSWNKGVWMRQQTGPDAGELTGHRLGRRIRWVVPAVVTIAWLVLGGIAGPFAGKLSQVSTNDNSAFLPASAESTQVQKEQQGVHVFGCGAGHRGGAARLRDHQRRPEIRYRSGEADRRDPRGAGRCGGAAPGIAGRPGVAGD